MSKQESTKPINPLKAAKKLNVRTTLEEPSGEFWMEPFGGTVILKSLASLSVRAI